MTYSRTRPVIMKVKWKLFRLRLFRSAALTHVASNSATGTYQKYPIRSIFFFFFIPLIFWHIGNRTIHNSILPIAMKNFTKIFPITRVPLDRHPRCSKRYRRPPSSDLLNTIHNINCPEKTAQNFNSSQKKNILNTESCSIWRWKRHSPSPPPFYDDYF